MLNRDAGRFAFAVCFALLTCLLPASGFATDAGSIEEIVTITGEVVALDKTDRYVTLRGPLGGEITGRVGDDVSNLDQVQVGDLLTISYYQSIALFAQKKGEAEPLFGSLEAGAAGSGQMPAAYATTQIQQTVTVAAVDVPSRSIVFETEEGLLIPIEVQRPEFAEKLQTVRVGDQIEVITTEAVIAEVKPAAPGAQPSFHRLVGTLIVDEAVVMRRVGNVVFLRNPKGRTFRVTVAPSQEFQLNGKAATIEDLDSGMKLSRTAFRVVESVSIEGD